MALWRATWLMLVVSSVAAAQKTATPEPMGTVTGQVMCADTQRPARFASIMLIPKDSGKEPAKPGTTLAMVEAHTGLDGTYTVTEVPTGDYYVVGVLSGYSVPVRMAADEKSASDLEKAMADVPLTHVTANRSVTANLTLEHGAIISGRALFDDGGPAVGVAVHMEPVEGFDPESYVYSQGLRYASQSASFTMTDDRGAFRFPGVRPGKYRITVQVTAEGGIRIHGTVMAPEHMQTLTLYAPGKFHQSEAQVIEVKAGEDIPDTDVKVALDATHTVSGRVLAKEDLHAPNGSYVALQDPADKTFRRGATVDANGEFHLLYVPEGTYVLNVQATDRGEPKDSNNPFNINVLRSYQRQKVNVIVGNQDLKLDDVMMETVKAKD